MTANPFLRSMTDAQLVRLWNRILRRIDKWGEGGSMFGIAESMLFHYEPGLYRAFIAVRAEGRRRRI